MREEESVSNLQAEPSDLVAQQSDNRGVANVEFTVFTPTYNRATTLPRLYESLKRQTLQNFEWLIVDDGSQDDTRALVAAWQKESPFPIRYFWQENQHKKVAFNRGVREARGELFLNIDADDELLYNAMERFHSHWHSIPSATLPIFSAVTGLCQTPKGDIIGNLFSCGNERTYRDSDSLEMHFVYHSVGEKCGFHRTSVLRQFPFPEDVPGLVSEGLVWWTIAAAGWKTRFVNECFRVLHRQRDNLSLGDRARHAPWYFSVLSRHGGSRLDPVSGQPVARFSPLRSARLMVFAGRQDAPPDSDLSPQHAGFTADRVGVPPGRGTPCELSHSKDVRPPLESLSCGEIGCRNRILAAVVEV